MLNCAKEGRTRVCQQQTNGRVPRPRASLERVPRSRASLSLCGSSTPLASLLYASAIEVGIFTVILAGSATASRSFFELPQQRICGGRSRGELGLGMGWLPRGAGPEQWEEIQFDTSSPLRKDCSNQQLLLQHNSLLAMSDISTIADVKLYL